MCREVFFIDLLSPSISVKIQTFSSLRAPSHVILFALLLIGMWIQSRMKNQCNSALWVNRWAIASKSEGSNLFSWKGVRVRQCRIKHACSYGATTSLNLKMPQFFKIFTQILYQIAQYFEAPCADSCLLIILFYVNFVPLYCIFTKFWCVIKS